MWGTGFAQSFMDFETVYRQHFERVWRTLIRLGVAAKDAPDAAQEVFLIVHRRLADFEGRSSVPTWLYGIAFRVAADRRRKASVRWEVLSSDGEPVEDRAADSRRGAHDPGQILERQDQWRILQTALDRLPLEQSVVLTWFEMEGLTGEQIAEALGIPLGTVRSRLRLAREAFTRQVALLSAEPCAQGVEGIG